MARNVKWRAMGWNLAREGTSSMRHTQRQRLMEESRPVELQRLISRLRVPLVPMLLVGMGSVLYVYRLGEVHFWSVAEGRSAMAASQIIGGGGWLVPEPPGNLLVQAPPLYAWLVACSFWLTGSHSEAAARLPSALAAVATLLVVYRHGLRIGGARVGRTAALATGVCVLFAWQARLAEVDTLLCLWVAVAYSALHRAMTSDGRQFLVFHAAVALAVMTSGLSALLFVAAPPAVYVLWQREWRRVFGRRAFWGALPVLLFGGGAWYAYVLLAVPQVREGLSLSEVFENIVHPEPMGSYALRLPLGLLPLTLALPWALAVPWKPARAGAGAEQCTPRGAARLALCWLTVPLVCLWLWPAKQTHFVLPVVPALAILTALALEQREPGRGFWSLPLRAGGAKLAAWLIPATCAVSAPVLATLGHAGGAWLLFAAGAVLTVVSLAARLSLDWSRRFGLEVAMVELWIVLLVVCGHLAPEFNLEKSHKPFLRVVRRLVPTDEPLAGVQLRANDLYYLDRPVRRWEATGEHTGADYAVVPRRWLDANSSAAYVAVLASDAVGRNDDLVLIRMQRMALAPDERGRHR